MTKKKYLADRFLDDSYSEETRRHVITLTVARLTSNACFRFAPPFLASISDDFNISLSRLGLALMVTEIAMGISPVLGRFVDRLHRRTAMAGGLLAISGAATIAAASPSVWIFVLGILLIAVAKFISPNNLCACSVFSYVLSVQAKPDKLAVYCCFYINQQVSL